MAVEGLLVLDQIVFALRTDRHRIDGGVGGDVHEASRRHEGLLAGEAVERELDMNLIILWRQGMSNYAATMTMEAEKSGEAGEHQSG